VNQIVIDATKLEDFFLLGSRNAKPLVETSIVIGWSRLETPTSILSTPLKTLERTSPTQLIRERICQLLPVSGRARRL